jgi:hypothetical protein
MDGKLRVRKDGKILIDVKRIRKKSAKNNKCVIRQVNVNVKKLQKLTLRLTLRQNLT